MPSGVAAVGDVVLTDEAEEFRAPIRATFLAVRADGGWRTALAQSRIAFSSPLNGRQARSK
jgi:hypothetical protein